MALKNNRNQQEQRRQNHRTFNDAPYLVSISKSVIELRRIYPEMTDKQFSKWYQGRYNINTEQVLRIISSDSIKMATSSQ